MKTELDWTEPARTCRFCKKMKEGGELFVKYGVRHHAHQDCFLKEKGSEGLKDLSPWMVGQFSFFLLKKHGLVKIALAIRHEANKVKVK